MADEVTENVNLRQMTRETVVQMNAIACNDELKYEERGKAVDDYVKVGKLNVEEWKVEGEQYIADQKLILDTEKQDKELKMLEIENKKKIELLDEQIKNEKSKRWLDAIKLVLIGGCYIGFNGAKMYLERKENLYITDRDFDVSEKKMTGLFGLFGSRK